MRNVQILGGDRMPEVRARAIALYLPQFHPIPENDKYWGKGFTEWTNVVKARPLYPGHYQPRIPADLGFYDLRLPEVREQQAELAEEAGIEGFCYWHYWFGNGKEVLEKPFDEVVRTGKPDFPFCIGWANHSWTTKTWSKDKSDFKNAYIFEQTYPGATDYEKHFYRLLNAFKDHRYIKVEDKLLFLIYDLASIPDFMTFKNTWNKLADINGIPQFYFVAYVSTLPVINRKNMGETKKLEDMVSDTVDRYLAIGVDGVNTVNLKYAELKTRGIAYKAFIGGMRKKNLPLFLEKYNYRNIVNNYYTKKNMQLNVFPQILVGNDRSPRAGRNAIIYYNSTPENFYIGAKKAIDLVQNKDMDHRIIFVNSWNEWGEGAYMEPDQKYGKGFILALRKALTD